MEMEIFASVPQVALEGMAWWGEYKRFDMGLFSMASSWFQFLVLLSLNTEAALAFIHSFIHVQIYLLCCIFFLNQSPLSLYSPFSPINF